MGAFQINKDYNTLWVVYYAPLDLYEPVSQRPTWSKILALQLVLSNSTRSSLALVPPPARHWLHCWLHVWFGALVSLVACLVAFLVLFIGCMCGCKFGCICGCMFALFALLASMVMTSMKMRFAHIWPNQERVKLDSTCRDLCQGWLEGCEHGHRHP